MRRFLLPLCLLAVTAGLAAREAAPTAAPAAVTTRQAGSPFPAVWRLQGASAVVWQAGAVVAAERARRETEWYAVAAWNDAVSREAERVAEQARLTAVHKSTSARRTRLVPEPTTAVYGSGACGGDLPPCSVMMCESGGNIRAENPRSTASGKWQIIDSTGDGYAAAVGRDDLIGVPASQWSEADQDDAARHIYRGGAGRGAWEC